MNAIWSWMLGKWLLILALFLAGFGLSAALGCKATEADLSMSSPEYWHRMGAKGKVHLFMGDGHFGPFGYNVTGTHAYGEFEVSPIGDPTAATEEPKPK